MLIEGNIIPQCVVGAGSLGGLLTLYESNYIKLGGLLPELGCLQGEYYSTSPRDLRLHLTVVSTERYTMDLSLTYLFAGDGEVVADPDLQLRIYFDARMVEVVAWAGIVRHRELRRLRRTTARELDVRWARNIMLAKWLDYLGDHAHHFEAVPALQTVE